MESASRSASILVVDDAPENLRLLSSALGGFGYEIRPVTSGRQAIDAARRSPPDLVLLDINMPELSGYEVCAAMKQIESLEDVPIIFLTALSETADLLKAFEVGGVDYITKPFQLAEVVARVKVHVDLRLARAELVENYERLRTLEKLRDDLVHMVVHDLRSPLSALLADLSMLRGEVKGALTDDGAQMMEGAVEAGEMLRRMTNQLLDVSRLEEGKLPLERSTVDVVELAREVCTSFKALAARRTLEVVGPVVELQADRELLRRVLENIVGNAIKHTPSTGRVRVTAARTSAGVRVSVEDDGRGIPEEARPHVFEKFGPVAARSTRAHHSAGLGLAFCKLAVEAHGGTIGVEAGAERGSVFWFELP